MAQQERGPEGLEQLRRKSRSVDEAHATTWRGLHTSSAANHSPMLMFPAPVGDLHLPIRSSPKAYIPSLGEVGCDIMIQPRSFADELIVRGLRAVEIRARLALHACFRSLEEQARRGGVPQRQPVQGGLNENALMCPRMRACNHIGKRVVCHGTSRCAKPETFRFRNHPGAGPQLARWP